MPENSSAKSAQTTTNLADTICPACGSANIDDTIPELDPVCTDCGAVVNAQVEYDLDPEKQASESDASEPWSDHFRVTNSTEYQVAQALMVLEDFGDRLDVSTAIREQAAIIYSDGAVETLTDGRSTELFVAACITIAGQENNSPIPAGKIAAAANVDMDSLSRVCRILRRELDYGSSPCPPQAYLDYLAGKLKLGSSRIAAADDILGSIPSNRLCGKHPGAFAGAALYLAADGEVTQRKVALATAVTTETIRVRVKECREGIESESDSKLSGKDGGS